MKVRVEETCVPVKIKVISFQTWSYVYEEHAELHWVEIRLLHYTTLEDRFTNAHLKNSHGYFTVHVASGMWIEYKGYA